MSAMPNIDPRALAQAVVAELKLASSAGVADPEIHASQHEFIAQMIIERRDRLERRKRIEERIAGSVLLTMILGVITALGALAMEWLRNPR